MSQLANMIAADILSIIGATASAAGGARGAVTLNASNSWGLSVDALADAIEETLAVRLGTVDSVAGSGKIKMATAITGTDVDTDMTVTGITTADEIIKAIGDLAGTPLDITSEISITDTNDVQCTTTDHTGKTIEVWYIDNSVA